MSRTVEFTFIIEPVSIVCTPITSGLVQQLQHQYISCLPAHSTFDSIFTVMNIHIFWVCFTEHLSPKGNDKSMWLVITEAHPDCTCWFRIPPANNVFSLSSMLCRAVIGLHQCLWSPKLLKNLLVMLFAPPICISTLFQENRAHNFLSYTL